MPKTGILHFDGSAAPNPGPNCVAAYVLRIDGVEHTGRDMFGQGTNNVAEYKGLINGLRRALREGISTLEVYGDSMIVIGGMKKGPWAKGKPHLELLKAEALSLAKCFDSITYNWVPRAENADADELTASVMCEDRDLSHLQCCAAPKEKTP